MKSTDSPPPPSRIPLNTLAIPFGLIGYAGCWSSTRAAFGWERWSVEPFWVAAGIALIWLVAAHTVRGRRTDATLGAQLRQPAQAPIAAIVPISVMLLGAHLHPIVPVAGGILVYAGAAASLGFAAWLVAQWIRHPIPVESIHGGYLLPIVAAGFIGAEACAVIGDTAPAMAAFGMGVFFWVVIFTIVLARLALSTPLPGPLVPTLAILAAPPAVGGMAWLALNGRVIDWPSAALLGATIFMMLVQIALLPAYRRLQFSLGFWSFTFSMAAVVSQIIVLSDIARYPGWQVVVIAALVAISALIVAVAVRSLISGRTGGQRYEERRLESADEAIDSTPDHHERTR